MTSDCTLKRKTLLNSFKCLITIKDNNENDIKFVLHKYSEYFKYF